MDATILLAYVFDFVFDIVFPQTSVTLGVLAVLVED